MTGPADSAAVPSASAGVATLADADPAWQHAALPLDFLIIGAQKSASTFVQHCLAAHPQVDMPRTESPNFEDPEYGRESMADLTEMLGRAPAGHRRGIKRPNYLALPEVPARLARHVPDAKLIVVLRDPVARAVSAYRHYVMTGRAEATTIDEAFRRLLDGSMSEQFAFAGEILDWGRYGEHLQRYQRFFPPNQMLVLMQDDVASDPARVFAATADFLDVDRSFTPPELHGRRNVGPQSPMHHAFRQTRFRVRRAYLDDRAAGRHPVGTRLRWPYMAALTAVDRYVLPRLPGRLDEPDDATVAALREYYRSDVELTQRLLDRDLRVWT